MSRTREIINTWDPMKLLSHAPDDEYEEEIRLINEVLKHSNDVGHLADEIKSIFLKMFGDDFTSSYDECLDVAMQILS